MIARTTGSGWLTVILAFLAGVTLVGGVWPALGLARARVGVAAPRDAVVGRPLALTVTVTSAAPSKVSLPQFSVTRATRGNERGEIDVVAPLRGVLHTVVVELRAAAPLGMVWWRRRFRCPLERPIEVAPAPSPVGAPWRTERRDATGGSARLGGRGDDVVRGIRDYSPGDPPKLIAWPASARTGALMVRELDAPAVPLVSIVVDLRGDPAAAEQAASHAAGLVGAALADGCEVELATAEAHGPCIGPVTSTVSAGRRLARAVPGPPPPSRGASGGCVHVVDARAPRWR